MNFTKRTTNPSIGNEFYIHTSCAGLNSCILINNCSVLPNCVGYAWGRAYEMMNFKPTLSRGNAEDWYNYNDGYERGMLPKLGAIICWKSGNIGNNSDGAGHVAVVEEIYPDGSFLTSNSAYSGSRFYTKIISSNNYLGSKYTFQGFIYLPVNFEELKSVTIVAMEVIQGLWGNNPERKIRLEEAGYNYNEVQSIVNNLLDDKDTSVTYIVRKGDNLSSIAKLYNTTWQNIYADNVNIIGSNPNYIQVGQSLTINY